METLEYVSKSYCNLIRRLIHRLLFVVMAVDYRKGNGVEDKGVPSMGAGCGRLYIKDRCVNIVGYCIGVFSHGKVDGWRVDGTDKLTGSSSLLEWKFSGFMSLYLTFLRVIVSKYSALGY